MRKYLNKGLIYEWFNAGKIPILIGLITWGLFAYKILENHIDWVRSDIGTAQSNAFRTVDLGEYFILGVIFLAIYIFASGVNKRSTTMFLCSGPYTKKQIKVNELICLLMTLGLFITMYLYFSITMYVRNNELLAIVNGYPQVILIEVIRLLLFGIIGILLMLELDLLFSNTIMAYFGMIGIGAATLFILARLGEILMYLHVYHPIMDRIFGKVVVKNSHNISILFAEGQFVGDELGIIIRGIIFLLFIIGIMLLIFFLLEKRAKLETSSKIFSCKANEKMIITYLSLGAGAFVDLIIIDEILSNKIFLNARIQPYLSVESFQMLAADMIIIAIATFISYKIINKVIKAIG